MSTVTPAEAREYLNISSGASDVKIQNFLDRAEAAIETQGIPLAVTARTEWVKGYGRTLWLSYSPVVSLTSVTSLEGVSITVGLLTVLDGGRVEYIRPGYFTSRLYSVVYQAGRATLPYDLKMAVLETTGSLMQSQRGTGAMPSEAQPGFTPVMFPPQVEQILAPYRPPIVG
jgi:hypothetical protein